MRRRLDCFSYEGDRRLTRTRRFRRMHGSTPPRPNACLPMQRWEMLASLFERAETLPPAERLAFLDQSEERLVSDDGGQGAQGQMAELECRQVHVQIFEG